MHDSKVILSSVVTWPFPLGRSSFEQRADRELPSAYAQVLGRLQKMHRRAQDMGLGKGELSVAFAGDRLPFWSFGDQPRGEMEVNLSESFLNEWVSAKLDVSYVDDPFDDDELRLDGSFLSSALGNWIFAVDKVDRWWGPGWDGSLILSNNARPVPALSLTRITPEAFENRWLSWIGPWTFTTFMGQLDNDEGLKTVAVVDADGNPVLDEAQNPTFMDVPIPGSDALLFGMRIDFSPFEWFDIGLSRTAQWAGDGRPSDLGTFKKLLLGEDNRVNDVTYANEPGNQLAGVDWRVNVPGIDFAYYGQIVGEDEETYLPDANMLLFGAETWGALESIDATWRVYYEWADTRAGHLLADPDSDQRQNRVYNVAYNHGIYSEGYRYRGRAIGHAMDGDGLMRSLGVFVVRDNGDLFVLKFRSYDINRYGAGPNSVSIDPISGTSVEFSGETALRF